MHSQLFVGAKPEKEKMSPVRNREAMYKPYGGLWTSTFYADYGSDWLNWCFDSDWYADEVTGWILVPERDVRVFTVDSYQDLEEMIYLFSEPIEGLNMFRNYDFEKMAQHYDCVHLTYRGFSETHLSMPHSLYGWDCESTVWLRWIFQEVKQVHLKKGNEGYYAKQETI